MAWLFKKRSVADSVVKRAGSIYDRLSSNIRYYIEDKIDELTEKIEERVDEIQRTVLRKLASFALIGLGVLLLILSGIFYLIEYAGWSRSLSFFTGSVVLIIIGLLIKNKSKGGRYNG